MQSVLQWQALSNTGSETNVQAVTKPEKYYNLLDVDFSYC